MVDSLGENRPVMTRGNRFSAPWTGKKEIIPKFLLILIYFADFFGLVCLIDRKRSAHKGGY